MLVDNDVYINKYVADGSTDSFPIAFPFLEASHIEVYTRGEDGEDILVDPSMYTITGAGVEEGGELTFNIPPAAGTVIAIIRNVPITQLYAYTELDNFPAESHENALAKLTMIDQQQAEILGRAVIMPVTSNKTPDEYMAEFKSNMDAAVNTAQSAAEDAAESRDDAAQILVQCQEIASGIVISTNSVLKAATMTITTAVAAGTVISLPNDEHGDQIQYSVGGHNLLLYYNGAAMFPGEQYSEQGTQGEASGTVKLLQELRAGDTLMVRVLGIDVSMLADGESITFDPDTGLSVNLEGIAEYIEPAVREEVEDVLGDVVFESDNTFNGSNVFTQAIEGDITGNAATATMADDSTKLGGQSASAYAMNGSVVKLSGDQEIHGVKEFEETIVGDISGNAATATSAVSAGNASTATKLATARNINGTSFDGSAAITTANWGTARNISISDSDGTNTGTAVSVNGSGNATLKLPATIKASIAGNASTATTSFGFADYSAVVDYARGATVKGSDGNLYVALLASGPSTTAVNPVGDTGGKWGLLVPQIGHALTVHGVNGRASVQVDNDLDGTDEDHRIGLESNSAGNAGIFDFTENSWIIWRDKDGANRLPGNTFTYSPDNGGTNYHNLSYVPMLDVRDFGAVGDGTTDDYAAIQAALNRAHAAGKMLVIPAGTYFISKHLEIGSNTTILGYGATIKRGFNLDASNYGSTVWLVRNSSTDTVCSNVHIFGLKFDNNGGTYNTVSQNIVTIGGKTSNGVTESFTANNISFIECTFENWINNHALDVASTKGLKVIRCIFRGVKYDKSLVASADVSFWKRREAIQFDDSPVVEDYNSDWLIDGNLFEGIDNTFVAPRVGIGQHGGEDNVNASYKNIKIVNNTFLGCGYAAITLFGVSDSVVSNNFIKDTFYGIEFNSRYSSQNGTLYKIQTNNVVIKGNMFVQQAYNKYSGKNVPFDPDNTTTSYADCFRFMEVHDNVEGTGVDFSAIPFGADNIFITDNSIAGYYVTFRSSGVTNTKICGNRISDCTGTLSGAASATDVSGNLIVNGGYGIRFSPSGWGYAPNDNNASICRNISVKDNAITIADVNNFKISTIESSNGYTQVTISGNSVHDDFLYSGSPQTSKYFEIKATSASVIAGNVVCAAEKRSTQEIAGTTTGNVVRDNDWFVNNVLQS